MKPSTNVQVAPQQQPHIQMQATKPQVNNAAVDATNLQKKSNLPGNLNQNSASSFINHLGITKKTSNYYLLLLLIPETI